MAKKNNSSTDCFSLPASTKPAIYAIVNIEDFSCYVGSTQNLRLRAMEHNANLLKNKHVCKPLQEAKNSGKKLKFLVLCEFEKISRSNLIIAEYCYMLQMLEKGFCLYNTNPRSKYSSQKEAIIFNIIVKVVSSFGTDRKIENAIQKEYGEKSSYIKRNRSKYICW